MRLECCSCNSGRIHKASKWGHKLHPVLVLGLAAITEANINSIHRTC